MEMMLNYIFAVIASYIGLFCGVALALISPEEIKPGRRYFNLIEKFLFIIICVLGIYTIIMLGNYWYSALIAAFALVALFTKKIKFHSYYILLAMLAALNDVVILSLIFIIGLPIGTLLAEHKSRLLVPLRYIYYPVLAIIMFYLSGVML